jgi:hypothetical protein
LAVSGGCRHKPTSKLMRAGASDDMAPHARWHSRCRVRGRACRLHPQRTAHCTHGDKHGPTTGDSCLHQLPTLSGGAPPLLCVTQGPPQKRARKTGRKFSPLFGTSARIIRCSAPPKSGEVAPTCQRRAPRRNPHNAARPDTQTHASTRPHRYTRTHTPTHRTHTHASGRPRPPDAFCRCVRTLCCRSPKAPRMHPSR